MKQQAKMKKLLIGRIRVGNNLSEHLSIRLGWDWLSREQLQNNSKTLIGLT